MKHDLSVVSGHERVSIHSQPESGNSFLDVSDQDVDAGNAQQIGDSNCFRFRVFHDVLDEYFSSDILLIRIDKKIR